jgi:hypothetical protein
MKKVIVTLSMFLLAFTTNVSARPIYMNYDNLVIKGDATEATIIIPDGRGTIKMVKKGDTFSDVVYTDAAGKTTRLIAANSSTGNLPKPACKYPLPDACFGSADKSIGMCICRPTNIAGTSNPYTVSLILPAVQSAREAARFTAPQ